jgi:hypothetical protein
MKKLFEIVKEIEEKQVQLKGKIVKGSFFDKATLSLSLERFEESATFHALKCDTFLAHSSEDIELIKNIILYFQDLGAKPYIDKDDMELPSITSSNTATTLIANIKACNKFVVIITDNSINSKWVPWELGVANISKGYNNIAVLQIEGNVVDGECKNNEYLGIYSQIREQNGSLIVYSPDKKKSVSINEWLKVEK